MLRAAVIVVLLVLLPSRALAEARVALLIGNQDYKPGVGALTNPLNDIRVVGEALKADGFEVLNPTQNARRADMLVAIYGFAAKLKAAGSDAIGFLYYSGHGIASLGENYLIPIDIDEPSTMQLSVQGVKQSEVLAILRNEAPNAAHYLVLDACRNNLQGARGGKGFVSVGQQNGVLVAFAAEPGKTASDTGQGSGPYAAALAAELVKPGQSDLIMFHRVRVAVIEKTGGDQVPWTEDGIQRRDRVLFGGVNKSTPAQPQSTEAESAWAVTKDTTNIAVLELFVGRYKDTYFSDLARLRIEELKKQQVAVATPPAQSAPAKLTQPAAITLGLRAENCDGAETQVGNERKCLKPKDSFRDCPTCPEMVVVPAGEFMMGSKDGRADEKPMHRVTIAKPFAIGKFEVTFAEWDACVAADGCKHKPETNWGRGRQPVNTVPWVAAKEYVAWLSSETGSAYRLLTEAEWEYAARAGSQSKYTWGDKINKSSANCNGCGSQWDNKQTAPVGSFMPNAFGIHDMHGNIWQWVEDCWHADYKGAPTDGSAWLLSCSENYRVLRGGSWNDIPWRLRSASRNWNSPYSRFSIQGFRIAKTLNP